MLSLLVLLAVRAHTDTGYVPDLPEAVVYEANIRAFGPESNLRGLAARLRSIRALGVNVLWLMPIQPVGKLKSAGGLGSPYAVADFDAVNPEFGSEQDLRTVVHEAHRLHMAVILDWVADHTSWDHPWIRRHPDWYLRDEAGRISSPPKTGWLDVAALDYRNRAMRKAMTGSMRSWIARFDVDGFRCDSSDRMPFDFWKSAIESLRASTHKRLLMLAEGYRPDDYTAGFDLTYGWGFCTRLRQVFGGKDAREIANAATEEKKDIPTGAERLRFITNHDISAFEGSLPELYKSFQGARTAFAIAALYGGVPLIYTGEEADYGKRIPIFEDSTIEWREGAWMAQLMSLRAGNTALRTGKVTDRSTRDAVVFDRRRGSNEVLVVANVRGKGQSVDVDSEWRGAWTDGMSHQAAQIKGNIYLPPYGYRIYVRGS